MIKISALNKSFGKLQALKDINLFFQEGNTIALIGPNASGKTTLIKCLLGLVIPDSGTMLYKGEKISSNSSYRQHIGYMPQIGRFPEQLYVKQVFDMIRDIRSGHMVIDEELIEEFKIASIYQKRMGALSGGTRQKVSAALAYLFDPDILVLDEPTAGLDPASCEILKQKIIKERRKGKLTLITSHNMNDVEELADRVVSMNEGEVEFYKTVDEIKIETGEQRLGKALVRIMNKENISQ